MIPTTLRRHRLLERALDSVAAQERQADVIVVTCDATEAEVSAARATVLWPNFAGQLHVMINSQGPGLGGNLNTAFEYMSAFCPDTTIVSLLDDDDFWSTGYLASVEKKFYAGATFVAAPFLYLAEDNARPQTRIPPDTLDPDRFLIGNPGISNSTMSIEFALLQEIGGWNAALRSCTDRDACLRLCDASTTYAVAHGATAYIDRRHGSPRLTDRGGAAKFDGLESFYGRWRSSMTPDVYEASRNRAFRLFDYDPGMATMPHGSSSSQDRLVVATISTCPALLDRLLASLDTYAAPVFRVTVIVLRNNADAAWDHPATHDLELRYGSAPTQGILKIAEARNRLQEKVREYVGSRQEAPPVWFLDEDFIVDEVAIRKIAQAMSARDRKADAILGEYVGDSPNAALSGLLYELQDLKENLHWLRRLPAQAQLPDRSDENAVWMSVYADTYHYALSLDPKPRHIAWLEPQYCGETVQEARDRLIDSLPRLTSGRSVFRDLRTFGDVTELELGAESVHRGGTIVIFDPAMLDVPFPVIPGPNGSIRRSDMMWALLAIRKHGHVIRRSNIATHHCRQEGAAPELSVEKTLDELIGSCVFNSLKQAFFDPDDERFADVLEVRAARTHAMLVGYFDDLDEVLDDLEGLGVEEVSRLAADLRNAIDGAFRERLLDELNRLRSPPTALAIKSQFAMYARDDEPSHNSCRLIRTTSQMTVSTHFDDHIQLLRLGDVVASDRPLIRLHSSCQFSETFGATDCDCAGQLDAALAEIEAYGCGAVLYLRQEGRGHGLDEKIRIVDTMQQKGITTYAACDALGLAHDVRCYRKAGELLKTLGIDRLCLLTNNPTKAQALRAQGFDLTVKALRSHISLGNRSYLASKNDHVHRGLLLDMRLLDDVKHDLGDPVFIDSTNGRFGELSNFSLYPVFEDGVIWRTSEHLYQSRKFASVDIRNSIRQAATPHKAKETAHAASEQVLLDWEVLRLTVMYSTVRLKLSQNPEVRESLLSTGRREIIEVSREDTFWGRNAEGCGDNGFGKILMLLRADFRAGP